MKRRHEKQKGMGTPLRNQLKRMEVSGDGSKVWDKKHKEQLLFEIERLLEKLTQSKNLGPDPATPRKARDRTIYVLDAVIHSLIWMPDIREDRLLQSLSALRDALVDFQKGRDHSLFSRPPHRGGRKIDSTDRKMMQLIAASAMEILMNGGHTRRSASSRVAAKLDKAGWKRSQHQTIEAGTVARWRDNQIEAIRRGDNQGPFPGLFRGYQNMDVSSSANAEERANELLDWLNQDYFLQDDDSG